MLFTRQKSTQIYTEKSTQLHEHRKENSCPGNNYRTGSEVCNILKGEHESISCSCKTTTFINYTKNCTGIYGQDENPGDRKQFAHFTKDEDGLKSQKLDSFRSCISKEW